MRLTRWATLVVLFVVENWWRAYRLPKGRPEYAAATAERDCRKAAVEMIASGEELLMHLWQSLKRELIAFLLRCLRCASALRWAGGAGRMSRSIRLWKSCGRFRRSRGFRAVDPLARHRQRAQNQFIIFSASSAADQHHSGRAKNGGAELVRAARCLGASERQKSAYCRQRLP